MNNKIKLIIKKSFNKLIPKTKAQKRLDFFRAEVNKGNILHIDDGIINGEHK